MLQVFEPQLSDNIDIFTAVAMFHPIFDFQCLTFHSRTLHFTTIFWHFAKFEIGARVSDFGRVRSTIFLEN